ncbi:hypothetical protein HY409_00130 [Candidatus Gottesmanbacteria bacterium]|nr:hypothetical protein [Candidatus Gottesmanbacteria bacterium]
MRETIQIEPEARDILLPMVTEKIGQFDNTTVFLDTPLLGVGNSDLRWDLDSIARLAQAAQLLDINPEYWAAAVAVRKEQAETEAIDREDPLTAIEIREEYIRYLCDLGNFQQAIKLASVVTDGIIAASVQHGTFDHSDELNRRASISVQKRITLKPGQIYRDIAHALVENGFLEKAIELTALPEMAMHVHAIAYVLIKHHLSHGNTSGILAIIDQAEDVFQAFSSDLWQRIHWNRVRNYAYNALGLLAIQSGSIKEALSHIASVSYRILRIDYAIDAMDGLVVDANYKGVSVMAEAIFGEIAEGYSTVIEMPQDATFSLSDEAISPQNAAERLAKLSLTLSKSGQYSDLVDRCLWGIHGDNTVGLFQAIEDTDEFVRPYLFTKVFEVFAARDDFDGLAHYYGECCLAYPARANDFHRAYALLLAQRDEDEARRIVSQIDTTQDRAKAFGHLVLAVLDSRNLLAWSSYIDELKTLEDHVIGTDDEWDLDDLDMDGGPSDEIGLQKQEVSFGSFAVGYNLEEGEYKPSLPWILRNIAIIALRRGEWEVFRQILFHPYCTNYYAVDLVSEVARALNPANSFPKSHS